MEGERVEVLEGDLFEGLKPTGRVLEARNLLCPVVPPNIYCIGLNYRKHALEGGFDLPKQPVVFMKPTSAVADPGQAIRIPGCCVSGPEVDYEAELAVVIGKQARGVSRERAMDYVLGYTCANDVSARRWQLNNGGQWIRGKSFDTFCPLGPALVTRDEVADPQALIIKSVLNGQVMQQETTADMIFSVAELVSFLSQDTTLWPGTVILTGTPSGVGYARKPPVFLKPGDQIVIEIEQIGKLVNTVG
jgi:2-keto-4-pentenoate hydratase/2-oxohepta-3-ene-1,7-dioic acid hydratase in catechol pathway